MMRRSAPRASVLEAAAVATDHVESIVVASIRDVHTSVSGRVNSALGLFGLGQTVGHRAHDGISGLVYASVGTGFKAASRGLREADRLGIGGSLESSPKGRFVVSAINGLIGDKLVADGSNMAIEMGIRDSGRDVPLTPEGLAATFPGATDALVVFVHGLCETEDYWNRRSRPRREDGSTAPSYGARLAAEEGWSPIYVRANSGQPITESGVELSSLLGRLVEAWPVEVRRIAFVGHSMGGLIVRAACAVHTSDDHDWKPLVTDIVTLGTPHLGSPVERTIERGMRLSGRLPELAPYARIFEKRSVGVLGLHDGMPEDVAQVPNARYRLVAATLSQSPRHPLASTIGDYLVPFRSAIAKPYGGRGERTELFPLAEVLHVPKADHFDLLNHDDIYAALRGWLQNPSRRNTA